MKEIFKGVCGGIKTNSEHTQVSLVFRCYSLKNICTMIVFIIYYKHHTIICIIIFSIMIRHLFYTPFNISG